MDQAMTKIEEFRLEHDRLPGEIAGNRITIEYTDSWEQPLRYEVRDEQILVRSAGPDRDFETGDDIVRESRVGRNEIRKIYPSSADSSSDSEFNDF
jgi:hypothetical protein